MKKEEYERVYAEVNLDAISGNLRHMRENLSPGTKIIAVVKADGYGHGFPLQGNWKRRRRRTDLRLPRRRKLFH